MTITKTKPEEYKGYGRYATELLERLSDNSYKYNSYHDPKEKIKTANYVVAALGKTESEIMFKTLLEFGDIESKTLFGIFSALTYAADHNSSGYDKQSLLKIYETKECLKRVFTAITDDQEWPAFAAFELVKIAYKHPERFAETAEWLDKHSVEIASVINKIAEESLKQENVYSKNGFLRDALYYILFSAASSDERDKAVTYYVKLLEDMAQRDMYKSIIELKPIEDPEFVRAAYANIPKGSATPERYLDAMFLHEKAALIASEMKINWQEAMASKSSMDSALDAYYNKMLKGDYPFQSEQELERRLRTHSVLTLKEKRIAYENHYLGSDELVKFCEMRVTGTQVAKDWPELKTVNATRILGVRKLDSVDMKAPEFSSRSDALAGLVIVLNGSRDKELYDKERKRFSDFGNVINRAAGAWARQRKAKEKEMVSLYKELLIKYNGSDARMLKFLRGVEHSTENEKEREALSDILNYIESIGSDNVVMLKGSIIAYTVKNKDNVIMIRSDKTAACVFGEGIRAVMGLNYAIDPNIVLINFLVVNKKYGKLNLHDSEPDGVAIGILATRGMGPFKQRVLLVDSVEGGYTFRNTINNGSKEWITEVLRNYAKSLGAQLLAINAKPGNTTPKAFLNSLGLETTSIRMSVHFTEQQHLESFIGKTYIDPDYNGHAKRLKAQVKLLRV